ncbi:hypothetical protein [Paenibacillus sp. y28]|uniref:hypothetical protein n=1 Tax=Paenibacillus sp. y28 TaxID=3129110 RepID=UPI0030185DDF
MRTIQRRVLGIMLLLSLVLLGACAPQNRRAAERIEAYLQSKYGEPFIVEAIGGGFGSMTTNTLKAEVHLKASPDKRFKAEITKDFEIVWDSYMNVIMAEKLDRTVTEMAEPLFGQKVWVKSFFDSGALSYPAMELNDMNISLRDYRYYSAVMKIFVQSDPPFDADVQARRLDALVKGLVEQGMKRALISTLFIYPEQFDRLQTTLAEEENIYTYFKNQNRSLNIVTTEIKNFNQVDDVEQIKARFYFK